MARMEVYVHDRDHLLETEVKRASMETAYLMHGMRQDLARLSPITGYALSRRKGKGFIDILVDSLDSLKETGKYNPKTVKTRVEESVGRLTGNQENVSAGQDRYFMGEFVGVGKINNPSQISVGAAITKYAHWTMRNGSEIRGGISVFTEEIPFKPLETVPLELVANLPRRAIDIFETSPLRNDVPHLDPVHNMVRELMELPTALGVVIAEGAYDPVYWDILVEGTGQDMEGYLTEAQAKAIIGGSRNQLRGVGVERPVYFGGLVSMEDSRDLPGVMDRYLEFAKDQRRRTIGNFFYFEP